MVLFRMEPRKQVKLPEAVTGLKMILDLMQLLYVVDGAHSLPNRNGCFREGRKSRSTGQVQIFFILRNT